MSLIPAEALTQISCANRPDKLHMFDEEYLETLANLVFNRSKNATLKLGYVKLQHMPTIDPIPQVTSLHTFCINSQDTHARLIHKCANTLLDLTIAIDNARALFYDADDNVVVYPHLEKLELTNIAYVFSQPHLTELRLAEGPVDVSKEQVSVPEVVTLPSLEGLVIKSTYLYADDVLFRGNSVTLKYLNIAVDHGTINMLNKYQVFRNRYKNLKITLLVTNRFVNLLIDPNANMNRCIGDIAGSAHTLIIESKIHFVYLMAAAPPIHGFESLQVLSVAKHNLSLFDVLSVLKMFPSLVKIGCGVNGVGPELAYIDTEDLPGYITSTYRTVGKNLQIWRPQGKSKQQLHTIPEYAMLMALVCPKLCLIEVAPNIISEFRTRVYEELQSGPFSKYTSQLSHLLQAAY